MSPTTSHSNSSPATRRAVLTPSSAIRTRRLPDITFAHFTEPLVWLCHVCGRPVKNGDGWLLADVYSHPRGHTAGQTWLLFLAESPPACLYRWHSLHRSCDPRPEAGDEYYIAVEAIRTNEDVTRWTKQIQGKVWYPLTNWAEVIRDRILPGQ